jgi:hypothetical protein
MSTLLKTEFGRKLFAKCCDLVKGTEWDETLFKKPLTVSEKKSLEEGREKLKGSIYEDYWK